MLIGYMRISKADGSQTVDLQRDALLAAGLEPDQLYQDLASGKRDASKPATAATAEPVAGSSGMPMPGANLRA